MSWAAIAKTAPVKAEPAAEPGENKPRVAVIDANALITQHGILNLVRSACMRAIRLCPGCRRRRCRLRPADLPAACAFTPPFCCAACRCGLPTSA